MPNVKSETSNRASVRETISNADKFREVKDIIDNSLFVQDLKENHGWDVWTAPSNSHVSVYMKKQGPIDSELSITLTFTELNNNEFDNFCDQLRELCSYPSEQKQQDKCVIGAIEGDTYRVSAEAEDEVHIILFSLNFSNSQEKVEGMSLSEINEEVKKAREEILTVSACLYGAEFDRPEMREIEAFLTENGISFTHEVDLQNCINNLIVDDDSLDLHFTVKADINDEFTLNGGLQFDSIESELYFINYVSPEEVIERLKAVENETGEYQIPDDQSCLKVYSYVNDGENKYAIIGPDRNDATACPLEQNEEGVFGYSYRDTFIPADKIKSIESPEHTYAELTGVLKDKEPERKSNELPGFIGSKLNGLGDKALKNNQGHDVQKPKDYENPGGRG